MTDETRGRHFPEMPPALPGEDDDAYTNRVTGADRAGRVPYDHDRNRQCSIGWHKECSDPAGNRCKCPCHTEAGHLELRLHEAEESIVILYAVASGGLREALDNAGWRAGLVREMSRDIAEIVTRRPKLAEWYLRKDEPA